MKKKRISLLAILLIVAVVVNVAMSGYICFDKVNDNKVAAEYEANTADMQKKIDDLQKSVDMIQNTSQEEDDETAWRDNLIDELYGEIYNFQSIIYTDGEDIIDVMAKVLFYKGASEIIEARAGEFSKYPTTDPYVTTMIGEYQYEKRDVFYSDVVKEYSMIFTGDALDDYLAKRFADIDGYLYVLSWGASGWSVKDVEVTRIFEANGEIKYDIKYVADFGSPMYSDEVEGTCSMTVKAVDGSYRISEFDFYKD